jgi:GTP cyclohydrolase I
LASSGVEQLRTWFREDIAHPPPSAEGRNDTWISGYKGGLDRALKLLELLGSEHFPRLDDFAPADWAEDPRQPVPADYVEAAVWRLLLAAEGKGAYRSGLDETPPRFARAWRDLTRGYSEDPANILKQFEGESYDELVLKRGIPFHSLCEHHLLPFTGVAHVGYIPNGPIVGLSKLSRLVDAFARRLQVQERITVQVADALDQALKPKGVIVVIEAEHTCVAMRGVEKHDTDMVTSAVRGVLKEKPEARAEALALIGGMRR